MSKVGRGRSVNTFHPAGRQYHQWMRTFWVVIWISSLHYIYISFILQFVCTQHFFSWSYKTGPNQAPIVMLRDWDLKPHGGPRVHKTWSMAYYTLIPREKNMFRLPRGNSSWARAVDLWILRPACWWKSQTSSDLVSRAEGAGPSGFLEITNPRDLVCLIPFCWISSISSLKNVV